MRESAGFDPKTWSFSGRTPNPFIFQYFAHDPNPSASQTAKSTQQKKEPSRLPLTSPALKLSLSRHPEWSNLFRIYDSAPR